MKMNIIAMVFCLMTQGVYCDQTISPFWSGKVSYPGAINLNSPTTGVLNQLAQAGKFYPQSQLLLSFDTTIIDSQIKTLMAQLVLQQKVLEEAKREFQRSEELYDGAMLSDHELKLTEIILFEERAKLQKLQSQLVEKKWQLTYHQLKAPFDGYVVASNVVNKQYIVNLLKSKPLLKFIGTKNIMIDVNINNLTDSKIKKLKEGDSLVIYPDIKVSFISYVNFVEKNRQVITVKIENALTNGLKIPKQGAVIRLQIK